MQEQDVIFVDSISPEKFIDIVENAIKYALISSPFTINRMSLKSLPQRIFNIAKGKIAEGLFEIYARENNLGIDFDTCATPFYQADKMDFIWKNLAWDIKNNFLQHDGDRFTNYISLPALIPNRSDHDQWAKREQIPFPNTTGKAFLFTFLKLKSKARAVSFLEIKLSSSQENLLERAYSKYKGEMQSEAPFLEKIFFDHFEFSTNNYVIHEQPILAITGFATKAEFNLFRNIDTDHSNVFDDFQVNWITNTKNGAYSFEDGALYGKIKNACVPISLLPDFKSLMASSRQ